MSQVLINYAGCIYLISMYYKRYELQWRLTLVFTASILAGAFAGVSTSLPLHFVILTTHTQLLAFAIAKMDGIGGYRGWRWIFILEGGVTVIIGLVTKFWLTDWPETAKFLNDQERALLIARLSSDTGPAVMNRLDKRAAKRIFSDPKIYLGTAAYLGASSLPYSTFTTTLTTTPRRRKYRLRRFLLHPHHCQRTRLHVLGSTGPLNTNLHRSNSDSPDNRLPNRPSTPPLRILHARSRRLSNRVHYSPCTA
jgi:hypothetical protein